MSFLLTDGKFEYLVRWQGYSPSWDTWEPKESFYSQELVEDFEKKIDEENDKGKEKEKEKKVRGMGHGVCNPSLVLWLSLVQIKVEVETPDSKDRTVGRERKSPDNAAQSKGSKSKKAKATGNEKKR